MELHVTLSVTTLEQNCVIYNCLQGHGGAVAASCVKSEARNIYRCHAQHCTHHRRDPHLHTI